MPKRKTEPEVIKGVEEITTQPPHQLPEFGDGLREFNPATVEPYTIIFTNGDTVEMAVEAIFQPLFLVPMYAGEITVTYDFKRITHLSREHGIFRLVLEDDTRAAIVSGQMLTVTNTPIVREEPPQDEPIADGDAAG